MSLQLPNLGSSKVPPCIPDIDINSIESIERIASEWSAYQPFSITDIANMTKYYYSFICCTSSPNELTVSSEEVKCTQKFNLKASYLGSLNPDSPCHVKRSVARWLNKSMEARDFVIGLNCQCSIKTFDFQTSKRIIEFNTNYD